MSATEVLALVAAVVFCVALVRGEGLTAVGGLLLALAVLVPHVVR